MKRLDKKIAIITGAARGIGFGIARKYAAEGAHVIILDLFQDAIDEAVHKLQAEDFSAEGFAANVADSEAVAEIFKQIFQQHGQIDILVNNAGITRDGLLMKMKEADWDMVMNVNLKGTFICTQKVCRYMMKKRRGAIINIASVIGLMGNAGQSNYAASKGGTIAFTKSAAKEFSSRNIRVNAVAPGFIETAMTEKLSQDVVAEYAKAIPLGKMGSIENVADCCVFLASKDSEYITGQTIQVDGGLIM
ncbi:MAG: 3-oxoacyl-[acyl-carrier-protein] reductase [Candidatus Cloacimonadales bacterium]